MTLTLIAIIHVIVVILLMFFILIQNPKGGSTGLFGGSGSNTLFGSTGADNFLTTTTKVLAVIFAATSIGMTYLISHSSTQSVLDTATTPAAAPTTPAAAPTAPTKSAPGDKSAPAQSAPEKAK